MRSYMKTGLVKDILVVLICLLFPFQLLAQKDSLQISLLTSSPYEGEVFTVYGHAALHVKDATRKLDVVFNYGIFDFSQPNFIYRFAKGKTDYMLGACRYSDYIIEYQMRGSSITEQVLNLSQDEAQHIWRALQNNYEPQNRTYRYNFFFDNCATRPIRLIEENVKGHVSYLWSPEKRTFRDMINQCTRNHPWLTFGCDLALGSPTDRFATAHEMMFLPEDMKEAVSTAVIIADDGKERPLVKDTMVLPITVGDDVRQDWLTPLLCAYIICILTLILTVYEYFGKSDYRWLDCFLFTMAGIGGCILFFLSFFSEHPCTSPNWNMLWIQPLQLCVLFFTLVKKWRKAVFYYHFINFAALMVILLGWNLLPQSFNYAVIPLIIALGLRSVSYICRACQQKQKLNE